MGALSRIAFTGIAILSVFSWSRGLPAQESPKTGFHWKTDLAKARAEARESGKPLLVVFR